MFWINLLITLVILVLVDIPNLILAWSHFENNISAVQQQPIDGKIIPLLSVYPIMAFAIVFYVHPLIKISNHRNIIQNSIKYGSLMGFTIVGAYELFSYGTFNNWSIWIVIYDITWSLILMSLTTGISYKIINKYINAENVEEASMYKTRHQVF